MEQEQYILVEETMASVIMTSDGRNIQGPCSRGIRRYAELRASETAEAAANRYIEEFLNTHSLRPLIEKMARVSSPDGRAQANPDIKNVSYRFDCTVTRIGMEGEGNPESVSIEVVRPW